MIKNQSFGKSFWELDKDYSSFGYKKSILEKLAFVKSGFSSEFLLLLAGSSTIDIVFNIEISSIAILLKLLMKHQ